MFLQAQNVVKVFKHRGWFPGAASVRPVIAVNGISMMLEKGGSLGIIGESGSGKTTLARMLLGLVLPTSGLIQIESGQNDPRQQAQWMRRNCRMIFQSLDAALNPGMTVRQIVEEPLRVHTSQSKRDRSAIVHRVLEEVHLPAAILDEYPYALSGGEKRRISIARILSLPPQLLIADEPVSSLDVSIRGRILMMLDRIRRELHTTLVVISHDLAVVEQICDRAAIMHKGSIVEECSAAALARGALSHPYSRALYSSSLRIVNDRRIDVMNS